MKLFFEEVRKDPGTILIMNKAEADALLKIVEGYLKTKPNKRSGAYKLAQLLDNELLV